MWCGAQVKRHPPTIIDVSGMSVCVLQTDAAPPWASSASFSCLLGAAASHVYMVDLFWCWWSRCGRLSLFRIAHIRGQMLPLWMCVVFRFERDAIRVVSYGNFASVFILRRASCIAPHPLPSLASCCGLPAFFWLITPSIHPSYLAWSKQCVGSWDTSAGPATVALQGSSVRSDSTPRESPSMPC